MHTATCERLEFNDCNFEELVRGASRRALRRIVSQLSRPRAAIRKAAVSFNHSSSANKKFDHSLVNNASNVAAYFELSFRLARPFFSVVVASQHRGFQFQVFSGGQAASRQNIAVRPNHSLKRRANSVPSGPLHFWGLSYVPRACWHTVVSRLAQTLGFMNPHLRRSAEKLLAADRRAFTRRVMWIDFEERLERTFQGFCPKQDESDPLGRLYLTCSTDHNPAYSRHRKLRSYVLNQAQISAGIRRLGLEHTLGETELLKTKEGVESGATISFSQNVAGTVSVFLFPYKSELAKVKEENILLAFGLEPTSLTDRQIEKYLEVFAKYCSATSAHTLGGLGDYLFRLRLMALDRRNRSVQSKALLLVLERGLLLLLAILGVVATLYTSSKWPFAQ